MAPYALLTELSEKLYIIKGGCGAARYFWLNVCFSRIYILVMIGVIQRHMALKDWHLSFILLFFFFIIIFSFILFTYFYLFIYLVISVYALFSSVVKMVNQLLAGVHIASAAEAMAFGARLGLNTRTLFDVITSSRGTSW